MKQRLPRVTALQIIRVLEKIGFSLTRQKGSHRIYKNFEGIRATVPFHSGKILHPKVLKGILGSAGITVEELSRLLRNR